MEQPDPQTQRHLELLRDSRRDRKPVLVFWNNGKSREFKTVRKISHSGLVRFVDGQILHFDDICLVQRPKPIRPLQIFYKIKVEPLHFPGLLAEVPSYFSLVVFADLDDGFCLIDGNTKAIFDEWNVVYELADVLVRRSVKYLRLKYFKKGRIREHQPG